jgi:hypothetical protein
MEVEFRTWLPWSSLEIPQGIVGNPENPGWNQSSLAISMVYIGL